MIARIHVQLLAVAILAAHGLRADEDTKFAAEIQSILQRACVQCHGPEKQKGKLRLDSGEALRKGGEDGAAVAPGSPEKSDLFRRIVLPEDDDDVMPPKGKIAHLTAAEIERVRNWIAGGARWPDGLVISLVRNGTSGEQSAGPTPSAGELQAIARLEKHGVKVRLLAAGVNWRRANLRGAGDAPAPEVFPLLREVVTLRELNLGGVRCTDGDLANIAALKNLDVLHLDDTALTDAGLQHLSGLENLTRLNLFGTAISDAGLAHLASLKKLRWLYLAETKVTPAGVAALQKSLPGLEIDTGAELKDLAKAAPPAPVKTDEKKSSAEATKPRAPAEPAKK
jgi:mono/diheme cytochrome c family protein